MARKYGGDKLTQEQNDHLNKWIVTGKGVGQINELFAQQGWAPVSDQTVWRHKQKPEVQADILRVSQMARAEGMANRYRLIESISKRLCQYDHMLNGTVPLATDVELIDRSYEVSKPSPELFMSLNEREVKLQKWLVELTSDPVSRITRITKADSAGQVQSTTTIEGDEFGHITSMAQDNDALEAAMDRALQAKADVVEE